jgi:hypothetical protein
MASSQNQDRTRTLGASRPGAILIAVGLGILALLANAGRFAETAQAGQLGFASWIGPARLGALRALKLDAQGRPPADIADVARRALPYAPLADEPFFGAAAAGFRAQGAAGSAADARLLREALRRNPRSREAHTLLLQHALASSKLSDAISELAVLNRLNPEVIETLMGGLGQAIGSESQVNEAVEALQPHPELYRPFLRGFTLANKPAPLANSLVARLPRSAMADRDVQRMAINLMIKSQSFREARALWSAAAPSGGSSLVHSPDFRDARSAPPFNWSLTADSTGAAERAKTGGIDVVYYGRDPGELVSQLLTLPPGTYTARLRYRSLSGTSGALGLQLRCAGSDQVLAVHPLDSRPGTNAEISLTFVAPGQSCTGQWLSVIGQVQEQRDSQEAHLESLDVVAGRVS